MKLFYFITKSSAGGAQTHVMQLARCFAAQGHEVTIMSQPGGWLEDEARKLGVRYLQNPHLANTMNPIPLVRAARVLKKALDEIKPDLVSCHSTIAGLVGRATIRDRIPTLFTAHGWGFAPRIHQPRRLIIKWVERFLAPWSRHIICVSTYDLNLAHLAGINNVSCVHNVVERFEPTAYHHQLIEGLFVGRLADQKDPLLLIQAIHQLPPEIRERLHLTLVGSGALEEDVRRAILNYDLVTTITLKPLLPRTEVLALMNEVDFFILTSHWEGLPRSILEAMAHSLPVIATDVGGVRDAVRPETGILIPHGDVRAAVEAMTALIEQPALRTRLGAAAHELAQHSFSLTGMCEKTEAVYRDVLKEKGL